MTTIQRRGLLAMQATGARLPLQVLHSQAGFYLGTADESGPVSRESEEYFRTEGAAQKAMDSGKWTQAEAEIEREHPAGRQVMR